jgi:predicted nucleic acid-binding protein
MRWLLDTNVISEAIKPRPHKSVLAWMAGQPPALTAISIVTQAELWTGIQLTGDDRRRRQLMLWYEKEMPVWLGERILPLTIQILVDWLHIAGELARQGITRDPADMLIAATARTHSLILATRNVRDFANTGVVVYDPWSGETHRMDEP